MRPCEDWCSRDGYHYGPCVRDDLATLSIDVADLPLAGPMVLLELDRVTVRMDADAAAQLAAGLMRAAIDCAHRVAIRQATN